MEPLDTKKIRACAPLLPEPGEEVVISLIEHIEALQKENDEITKDRDELRHTFLEPCCGSYNFRTWLKLPATHLPWDQLRAAIAAPHHTDLCIAGELDQNAGVVTLVRGDFESIVVPLSHFTQAGDGVAPHFEKFSITDHGNTIKFGKYEAAFDAILYELDAAYRGRIKKQRIEEEQGLGASLRRLRLQRGVRREDFPGVQSKTIARIERGEITRPRPRTLEAIARHLAVRVDELEDW